MKVINFVFIVVFATAITFIHTHQKVEARIISYKIKHNQSELNKLLDRKEELEYNVAKLKAPTYLELRLAKKDVKLVLPERWQIAETKGFQQKTLDATPVFIHNIATLFSLHREAHATPANK